MSIYTEARKLDNHKCRVFGCGRKLNVQVHHIIPRSQDGPDELWNLICLCQHHHHLITDNKLTDVKVLTDLINKADFRWLLALDWHLKRQELKRINNE